jgi:hypothetical protein
MLIAPTVKTFFTFFCRSRKPGENLDFPESATVVIDLFAAVYFTKNVIQKVSSGQNLRKGFFILF